MAEYIEYIEYSPPITFTARGARKFRAILCNIHWYIYMLSLAGTYMLDVQYIAICFLSLIHSFKWACLACLDAGIYKKLHQYVWISARQNCDRMKFFMLIWFSTFTRARHLIFLLFIWRFVRLCGNMPMMISVEIASQRNCFIPFICYMGSRFFNLSWFSNYNPTIKPEVTKPFVWE